MVNRGASTGCITCRERRVKCDEQKPKCKECLRLGRECAGYGRRSTRVRFKDVTARFSGKSSRGSSREGSRNGNSNSNSNSNGGSDRDSPLRTTTTIVPTEAGSTSHPRTSWSDDAILQGPPQVQQDYAVDFFLTYVTHIGRSKESTRGFLEFIRPALATERPDSALSTAVNAVAMKLWAWLNHPNVDQTIPGKLLGHALVRLQDAVEDPEERARDTTVLAALLLQMYDTLAAVFDQQRAQGTHREGALALLLTRADGEKRSKFFANLAGNILHAKVSMCVREGVLLPPNELEWLETQVIPIVPMNPSTLLDIIGLDVAKVQHLYSEAKQAEDITSSSAPTELFENIQAVDAQLKQWLEVVPQHWYPFRVHTGRDIDPSIATYQGACEVYPSVQVANIWNAWRIYRLIVEKIKLQLSNSGFAFVAPARASVLRNDLDTREIQDITDGLCHSIPFYLGNRTSPVVMSDMDDPHLTFPTFHDVQQTTTDGQRAFLQYRASDHHVSRLDHARHVILQGPLHMTIILSRIIDMLFAEDEDSGERGGSSGSLPAGNPTTANNQKPLRPEQEQWISEQFLRALYLLRLLPESARVVSHENDTNVDDKNNQIPTVAAAAAAASQSAQAAPNKISKARILASALRRGLWTLTVL